MKQISVQKVFSSFVSPPDAHRLPCQQEVPFCAWSTMLASDLVGVHAAVISIINIQESSKGDFQSRNCSDEHGDMVSISP